MNSLLQLADDLSQQDRDEWAKKIAILEERNNEDDEFFLLIEAFGLLSSALGKKLDTAIDSLADQSEVISKKDIERTMKESVNIPSFQELRGFVMDTKALHERNEARQNAEDKNLEQIDRITRELKSLTGKSFLLWISCVTTGALVGVLCFYLPKLVENFVL